MSKDGLADVANAPSVQMECQIPVGVLESENSSEVQAKEKTISVRNRSHKRKAERQPTNAGRKPIRPIDRLKMRPWLIGLLDKDSVVGVQWVNREELVFQVSWRHAAQHGWTLEKDGDIFERWARHTGKYVDGDNPDPKRWKANFRCALHSLPDVQEVGGNRKGRNACRIYKFHNGALPDKLKQKKRQAKQKAKDLWTEYEDDEGEEEEDRSDESRSEEDSNSEPLPTKGMGDLGTTLGGSVPYLIKYLQRQVPAGKRSGMVNVISSAAGSQPLDLTYRGSPTGSASSTPPPQPVSSVGNLPLVVQPDAFTARGKDGKPAATVTLLKVRKQDGTVTAIPQSAMLTQMVASNMIGQPQVAMPMSKTQQSRPNLRGLEVLLQAAEQQMGTYQSLCEEVSSKKQGSGSGESSSTAAQASSSSHSLSNGVGHSTGPSAATGQSRSVSSKNGQPASSLPSHVAVAETISRLACRINQGHLVSKSPENSHSSTDHTRNPIPHLPAFATDHVYTSTRPPVNNERHVDGVSSGSDESAEQVIKTEPEDPEYDASSHVVYHPKKVKLEPADEDRHVMSRSYMEEDVAQDSMEDTGADDTAGSVEETTSDEHPGIKQEEEMDTDPPATPSLCLPPLGSALVTNPPSPAQHSTVPCSSAAVPGSSSSSSDSNLTCDMCRAPGAKTICIRVPEGNRGMGSYYHRSFCPSCSEKVVGPGGQECHCPQGWTNIMVPCSEHDNPADCRAGRCVRYSVVLHWTVVDDA